MKNLILSTINYTSLPLINILILPKITKSIDPVIYGEYVLFNNILSMISIFSFLGILPIVIQRYLNKDFFNYKKVKEIVFYLNYLVIVIYFIIMAIIFFIFKNKLLICMALNIIFIGIIDQIIKFYVVNGEIRKSNKIKFYNIIIYIFSLILFIKLKSFSVYSLFIGNLLYNFLILFYFGIKNKQILKRYKIDFKLLHSILKYGIPFISINISGLLLNSGDRYMMKLLMENSDYWIGIYSIQYSIYNNIFLLIMQLYYLYIPNKLYIIYEKEGIYNFIKKLKKWIDMYIFLGVLIVVLILIEYPKINKVLLSAEYNLNIKFVIYIVLGGFLFGLYRLMGEVLNMLELTNYLNITIWSSGILNLTLNYFFIPKFGIKGAAITTFLSYFSLVFIIFYIILKKTKKKILNIQQVIVLFIFIFLIIFLDNFTKNNLMETSKIKLVIQGLIEGFIISLCYFIIFKKKIFEALKIIKN